jgi:hypothetical protein
MVKSNPDCAYLTNAVNIGSMTFESLTDVQSGTVFGVSARGIFIKTASKWLNFISFERFRGPLTINLHPEHGLIPNIKTGMELEISPQNFIFPEAGWIVSIQEAEKWLPQPPSNPPSSTADQQARLISLASKIMETNSNSGFAPLIPNLFDSEDHANLSNLGLQPIQRRVLDLLVELNSSQGIPDSKAVINLLGSGSGLTPSGDDFVIGLLLALNRWKVVFFNLAALDQFNHQIVEAAYHKTTTLSANLIECATLGLGDDRLIDALDWLICGSEQESDPGEDLLSWGSSSGIDVFVGYVAALSI